MPSRELLPQVYESSRARKAGAGLSKGCEGTRDKDTQTQSSELRRDTQYRDTREHTGCVSNPCDLSTLELFFFFTSYVQCFL